MINRTHIRCFKKWALGTVLGLIIAMVVADVYLETVGLPLPLKQWVLDSLERQGIVADIGRVKMGVVRGVKAYDVTVWDERRGTTPMIESERIRCRLAPLSLLIGRFDPRTLEISGGRLDMPIFNPDEEAFASTLSITQLRADARWDSKRQTLEIQALQASIEGVRLELTARLSNFAAPEVATGTLGWHRITMLRDPVVQRYLKRFDYFLETNRFTSTTARISLDLRLDLQSFDQGSAKGDFRLNDLTAKGVRVPEFISSFTVDSNTLSLRKFRLSLAQDTVLDGNVALKIPSRRINLDTVGSVDPRLVFRLFDIPMPRVLAQTEFVTPPHVELNLAGVLDDPQSWRGDCRFRLNGLGFGTTYFQSVSGYLLHDGHSTELQDVNVVFDRQGQDRRPALNLHGSFDRDSQAFAFGMQGRAPVGVIVQAVQENLLPVHVPEVMNDFNFAGTDVDVDVVLEGSVKAPESWSGNVKLITNAFTFRDLRVERFSSALDIDDGIVTTREPWRAVIDSVTHEFIEIQARLNCIDQTLQGTIEGALNPMNCYRAAGLADISYLDETRFKGPPAEFTFTLQEGAATRPLKWSGQGRLSLHDVTYETLAIATATAKVELTDGHLFLKQVDIDSSKFEKLYFDFWDINLVQTEITVSGVAVGDPKDLGIFADRGQSRREYQAIWKDFEWGDEPPVIQLKQLKYVRYPDEITRWRLTVDAEIKGGNASYRGFHANKVEGRIEFDLPNTAAITEIKVERDDGGVKGNLYFDFTTDPIWWFDCKGKLNPAHLFKAAGDDAAEIFETIDFGDDTQLSMAGKIHMRGGANTQLNCDFSGPNMTFKNIELANFDLTWQLAANDLRWEIKRADLHGGKLAANGLYNWFSGSGTLDLNVAEADLSATLVNLGREDVLSDLGRVTGEVHTEFRRWSEDRPVNIRGVGSVKITEGRLWEAPIVKQLGGVVGLGNLGRIAELNANVVFDGNRLEVPQFYTDGTILSLEGDGVYEWEGHTLDFNVKGRALKTTGVIGRVFSPLSWLFEAKLEGTVNEPNWVPMSKFRDLIPGGSE